MVNSQESDSEIDEEALYTLGHSPLEEQNGNDCPCSKATVSKLETSLKFAAHAGLKLLKENNSLKEQLNRNADLYQKLREDYSLERQRNMATKNKLSKEYEEQVFELQNQLEQKDQLTASAILNSKPYEELMRKYDQMNIMVCELKNELARYENAFAEMNTAESYSDCNTELWPTLPSFCDQRSNKLSLSNNNNLENGSLEVGGLNQLIQDEISLLWESHQKEIFGLQQNIKVLSTQNQKLNEQLNDSSKELAYEVDVSKRAIESCKKLSIHLVDANNEILRLKYKMDNQRRSFEKKT